MGIGAKLLTFTIWGGSLMEIRIADKFKTI